MIVKVSVFASVPPALLALMLTVKIPTPVDVPEINPVDVSTVKPAGNPVAFVGYPGEAAILQSPAATYGNFIFNDGSGRGDYFTIANLILRGGENCISDGGFWMRTNDGALGVRVVGNTISAAYGGQTLSYYLVDVQNDHWRILGNEFKAIRDKSLGIK